MTSCDTDFETSQSFALSVIVWKVPWKTFMIQSIHSCREAHSSTSINLQWFFGLRRVRIDLLVGFFELVLAYQILADIGTETRVKASDNSSVENIQRKSHNLMQTYYYNIVIRL